MKPHKNRYNSGKTEGDAKTKSKKRKDNKMLSQKSEKETGKKLDKRQ
jgi:hypothetical protein